MLVGVYAAEAAGVFGFGAAAGRAAAAAGTIALGKGLRHGVHYSQQAGGVITAIAAHFQSLARQRADYAAAEPLLSAAPAPRPADGEDIAASGWRTLSLEGVRFAHGDGRASALELDRLALVRGRRYALVGPSGAGKTTPAAPARQAGRAHGGCPVDRRRAVPQPPPRRSSASVPSAGGLPSDAGGWRRCRRVCAISPP